MAALQYTYKNECFISDKSELKGVIVVLVLACIDVILFFAAIGYSFWKDSDALFYGELIAVPATLMWAWGIHRSIRQRQKPALARRRRALAEGTRYEGKIVDAGMKIETEQYEALDKDDHWRTCYERVPNYWIEVEYFDPQSGQTMRAYAFHMIRSMEHLIGRSVDVYVRQVWEDCLGKYMSDPYIDTCGL